MICLMTITILKFLLVDLWEEAIKTYPWQKKKGLSLTKSQLKKWGLKYHKLIMGKPSYDFFIDDKNLGFKKNWHGLLKKKIEIN